MLLVLKEKSLKTGFLELLPFGSDFPNPRNYFNPC